MGEIWGGKCLKGLRKEKKKKETEKRCWLASVGLSRQFQVPAVKYFPNHSHSCLLD